MFGTYDDWKLATPPEYNEPVVHGESCDCCERDDGPKCDICDDSGFLSFSDPSKSERCECNQPTGDEPE